MAGFFVSTKVAGWSVADSLAEEWGLLEAEYN
jgi:hypothetical protein